MKRTLKQVFISVMLLISASATASEFPLSEAYLSKPIVQFLFRETRNGRMIADRLWLRSLSLQGIQPENARLPNNLLENLSVLTKDDFLKDFSTELYQRIERIKTLFDQRRANGDDRDGIAILHELADQELRIKNPPLSQRMRGEIGEADFAFLPLKRPGAAKRWIQALGAKIGITYRAATLEELYQQVRIALKAADATDRMLLKNRILGGTPDLEYIDLLNFQIFRARKALKTLTEQATWELSLTGNTIPSWSDPTTKYAQEHHHLSTLEKHLYLYTH